MTTKTKPPVAAETPVEKPTRKAPTIPLIEPAPPPEAQGEIFGVFSPNMFQFPTHEELVAVLLVLGLRTRGIVGQDQAGNYLDGANNVVIPATLRQFFQVVESKAA